MKTFQFYLLLICTLSITSCKKEGSGMFLTSIRIQVFNSQGQNLLSAAPLELNQGNIEVYYNIQGKETLQPKSFYIEDYQGQKVIVLTPTQNPDEEFPLVKIKLGNLGSDNLKCQLTKTANSIICTKVWVNGELKYNGTGERTVTLIK
jgi:hypothetical protein